jgi:hypothetical protein
MLAGKSIRKKPLGRYWYRWMNNSEVDQEQEWKKQDGRTWIGFIWHIT